MAATSRLEPVSSGAHGFAFGRSRPHNGIIPKTEIWMSDSIGAPSGEATRDDARPTIDVKAMPHILRRIVVMALQTDPLQVTLAIVFSLGPAPATLLPPPPFRPPF